MGTITFDGVRFALHTNEHEPPHVHGKYAGIEVIIDLYDDGVQLSRRKRNVIPPNAKLSDIAHVLNKAGQHRAQLLALWRDNRAASGR